MTLTKQFDGAALVSALKAVGLAGAPKLVGDFFTVLFAWIAGSVAAAVSTNPYFLILAGFIPQLVKMVQDGLVGYLPGLVIASQSMPLAKAWDKDALISSMKAAGIPDIEAILEAAVSTVFDWISSSLAMGNLVEQGLAGLVTALGNEVLTQLKAFETKVAATV